MKTREPGLPVFLLGHSAGGVVACVYALENQDELTGLICESFAYQVPAPDIALAVLKGLSHIAPHAHVLKLKNEDFSRDPKVVAAMNADPLIANEITADADGRGAGARGRAPEEGVPADHAALADPARHGRQGDEAQRQPSFYERAGSDDKTLKLYEGHYHDLLNDIGKQRVMADIQAWIDDHLPRTPIRRVEEIRV